MTTSTQDTFTDALATAVRDARKARGWTQQTLADLAGVSQGSLSYFEKRGQGLHIEKVLLVLGVLGFELALTEKPVLIQGSEETIYPAIEATGAEQVQP